MYYKVKRTSFIIALVIGLSLLMGCHSAPPSHDATDTKRTEASLAEGSREVGVPNIVNWQQKKTLKWIYELCDREKLICYAYVQNKMTGKFLFMYKCLGYPMPVAAQYTAPEKVVEGDKFLGHNYSGFYPMLVPQPEPNGIYMPTSSQATWLIMINPDNNEPEVHYAEPDVYVSASKLRPSLLMNPEDYAVYDKFDKKPATTKATE